MTHNRTMLATAGIFLATGAIDAVRADDRGVTLYTGIIGSGVFHCNAINVSGKALLITISVIGPEGEVLAASDPMPTPSGMEASEDFGTTTRASSDAYCKFVVSGTSNRDDVRAVLNANRASTFTLPDSTTPIPFYVSRIVEAH